MDETTVSSYPDEMDVDDGDNETDQDTDLSMNAIPCSEEEAGPCSEAADVLADDATAIATGPTSSSTNADDDDPETALPNASTFSDTMTSESADRYSSTVIEIEALLTVISDIDTFPCLKHYEKLLHKAKLAHKQLLDLGLHHDLRRGDGKNVETDVPNGTVIGKKERKQSSSGPRPTKRMETETNNVVVISTVQKDELYELGRTLWSKIRNHSDIFQDYIAPIKMAAKDSGTSDASIVNEESKMQDLRAAASGYVRSLTGRLLMMNCIDTKDNIIPRLCCNTSSDMSSTNTSDQARYTVMISGGEKEFALKCFARAGRALLVYAKEPTLAFSALSLATSFWDSIITVPSVTIQTKEVVQANYERITLAKNCVEDAMDAFSMKVESAATIPPSQAKTMGLVSSSCIHHEEDYASSTYIIEQLNDLDAFVHMVLGDFENSNGRGAEEGTNGSVELISSQRILPSAAKTCFKQGNRLARQSELADAQTALDMALRMATACLHHLRQDMKQHELSKKYDRSRDKRPASNHTALSSMKVEQQEIQVVMKQCLYVLCHVHHSKGDLQKARSCLDQIECLVLDQAKQDESLFQETMTWLSKSYESSVQSKSISTSALALEGPKQQDMADIRVRAQTARAKAKRLELVEHANLAFSKIMLCHNTPLPGPTDEEEDLVDEQIKVLAELSKQSSPSLTLPPTGIHDRGLSSHSPPSISQISRSTEPYDLVMAAVKATFIRRLTRQQKDSKDPYSMLFQIYQRGHSMHLRIVIDSLSALLSTIQDVREDGIRIKSHSITDLDERAIEVAKGIQMELQKEISKSNPSSASDPRQLLETSASTLFTPQLRSDLKELKALIQESQAQFSRAVSFYHHLDNAHHQTIEWCDLLLSILPLSQSLNPSMTTNSNGETNSLISKNESDKTIAGVLVINAYALSRNGNYDTSLKLARQAWELDGSSIGGLVTLFQCSFDYHIRATDHDSKKLYQRYKTILLELDSAISTFLSSPTSSLSNESQQQKLLNAFPALCNICDEQKKEMHSPLLCGIQLRWLDHLTKSTQMTNALNAMMDNATAKDAIACYGDHSLFQVFCPCLVAFESILSSPPNLEQEGEQKKWLIEYCNSLDKSIDSILRVLVKVRGVKELDRSNNLNRCYENMKGDLNSRVISDYIQESKPMWAKTSVEKMIGTQEDSLWIGEQLWNISIQMMSIDSTEDSTLIDCKWFAAQFFAKAHDFALLSEEEEGARLTDGLLVCEGFDDNFPFKKALDFNQREARESDICSEFTAQCLVQSVVNVVDIVNMKCGTSCEPLSSEFESRLSKAMARLTACLVEAKSLDHDAGNGLEKSIIWIALNLLVAMRDDVACHDSLTIGGLSKKIESELRAHSVLSSSTLENSEANYEGSSKHFSLTPLSNTYTLACCAERNFMPETSRALLQLCINEMNRSETYHITIDGSKTSTSIGYLQKKVIQFASSVKDVVNVMETVQHATEGYGKKTPHEMETTDCTSKDAPYSTEEVDYFAIEAHNRAVRLLHISDLANAEKLLAIALNLIPFCGKQVESHSGEIRRTYRVVMERKSASLPFVSMCPESMIRLFAPLN